MSVQSDSNVSGVVQANVTVHSAMASTYNEREPHFRPENQEKVKGILSAVSQEVGRGKLLDLGCGTGFIIGLARDLFDEIHGVDITKAMLDRVDLSSGNIRLYNQQCENLPFENDTFDAATAYSFLDHLEDYSVVLKEAFRVLRPGGVFYADLLPNKRFWDEVSFVSERDGLNIASPIARREVEMLRSQHEMVEKEYEISGQAFLDAEPWKTGTRGISSIEFANIAKNIGYSGVEIDFQWYLGEGNLLHSEGAAQAETVARHLTAILPMSENLFKYLRVKLTK